MIAITDVHMHVIPSVDDGSQSFSESIEMISSAAEQGVTSIIATPHSFATRYKPDAVASNYKMLKKIVDKKQIPIKIYLGAEVLCSKNTMKNIIKELKYNSLLRINKTRYVLTEFDPWVSTMDALFCLKALINNFYIPIIAHVERYSNIELDDLFLFKKLNALLQINLYSLVEEKNISVKTKARNAIKYELVDMIGTDAHRIDHRPPRITSGLYYLIENCDDNYIKRILNENAKEILTGGIKYEKILV